MASSSYMEVDMMEDWNIYSHSIGEVDVFNVL